MTRVAVIMAGGAGERFWPASHGGRPKQLLRLLSDRTMLEEAIRRIEDVIPQDHVYIVLGSDIEEVTRRELVSCPKVRFIVEPARRNTTACLALAHARISAEVGPHACAVLTADHLIRPASRFLQQVRLALKLAEEGTGFVLMGKRPTRPETGFGYIETGAAIEAHEHGSIFGVERFKEKPDFETALHYVQSERYLWNSGMFFWRSDLFEASLRRFVPAIGNELAALNPANSEWRETFKAFPSLPIDIAVMERADNLRVIEADFEWEDVGTWTALERLHDSDESGNVVVGGSVVEDSENCIVYVDRDHPGVPPVVALLGVRDLVVAVSSHRVLVTSKSRAQDVRRVVRALEERQTH